MHSPFLYIDTGDNEIDKRLAGWKAVVGYGMAVRKKVLY